MSTQIKQATPEELDTPEKLGKHAVSVFGGGQAAVLQAILFTDAGFKVTFVDPDQTMINNIARGRVPFLKKETQAKMKSQEKAGSMNATSDFKEAVSHSDIIAITTPTKITYKKKTDCSEMESTCKKIGSSLQKGSLIIIMGLAGIGMTEGPIKEALENTSGLKAGTDFGLAYSPLQTAHTQTLEETANRQRMVAATDKDSLRIASLILETITKRTVRKAASIKTAEVAALLEVLQRDVRIAFKNEAAVLCEKAGVDYIETQKIMDTSTDSPPPPSTFDNDSDNDEPYILLEDADNFNLNPRIARAARSTNEDTVKHVTDLVRYALKSCGKTLKRARITVLGASQTPNAPSPFKNSARKIVETLQARGAKISIYDPYLSESEIVDAQYQLKKNMNDAVERADCLLILTLHEQFKRLNLRKMRLSMKAPAAIVDLENAAEPSKIEKEGFVYRGLGRGGRTR